MNKKNTVIIAIILGFLFVAISIFLLTYLPCPTNTQFFVLRTSLSLGTSLLALLITGFIQFKYYKIVTAGGGFALFLLTYLYTPEIFSSRDNCNDPFSVTVFLRDKKGEVIIHNKGTLSLFSGDELKIDEIDAHGSSMFKNIPSNYKNSVVKFELSAKGWAFENGKNFLIDTLNSITKTFIVKIDNTLCCIYGYVKDNSGLFLNNVNLAAEGVKVTSDSLGYFEITIPESRRKPEILLVATKEGFESWEHIILPEDKNEIKVILNKL